MSEENFDENRKMTKRLLLHYLNRFDDDDEVLFVIPSLKGEVCFFSIFQNPALNITKAVKGYTVRDSLRIEDGTDQVIEHSIEGTILIWPNKPVGFLTGAEFWGRMGLRLDEEGNLHKINPNESLDNKKEQKESED